MFSFRSTLDLWLSGSTVMLKARLGSIGRTVFAALLLYAVHVPIARGDSANCLFRFSAYVRELDPLLAEAKYSLTPIFKLNDRYFPFVDCDPDALKKIASRSRFFREARYSKSLEEYLFEFSSDDVAVDFIYRPNERTSFLPSAGWTKNDW